MDVVLGFLQEELLFRVVPDLHSKFQLCLKGLSFTTGPLPVQPCARTFNFMLSSWPQALLRYVQLQQTANWHKSARQGITLHENNLTLTGR